MDKSQIQPKQTANPRRSKALIHNALHKSSRRRKSASISDEKEAVERKIRALQSIVPGGESLGVDKLFEHTAEYIMNLQHQLKAMRALSTFFESLETDKCNRGG